MSRGKDGRVDKKGKGGFPNLQVPLQAAVDSGSAQGCARRYGDQLINRKR